MNKQNNKYIKKIIICFILIALILLNLWKNAPLMYRKYMLTPKVSFSEEEIESHASIAKDLTPETISKYVIDNIDLFSRIKSVMIEYFSTNQEGTINYIDKKVIFTSGLYAKDLVTKKFENTPYNAIMNYEEWAKIFEKLYQDGMAPDINEICIEWNAYPYDSNYIIPYVSIYFIENEYISKGIRSELEAIDIVEPNMNSNNLKYGIFGLRIPNTSWEILDFEQTCG